MGPRPGGADDEACRELLTAGKVHGCCADACNLGACQDLDACSIKGALQYLAGLPAGAFQNISPCLDQGDGCVQTRAAKAMGHGESCFHSRNAAADDDAGGAWRRICEKCLPGAGKGAKRFDRMGMIAKPFHAGQL